jgi:hypothetical protein
LNDPHRRTVEPVLGKEAIHASCLRLAGERPIYGSGDIQPGGIHRDPFRDLVPRRPELHLPDLVSLRIQATQECIETLAVGESGDVYIRRRCDHPSRKIVAAGPELIDPGHGLPKSE